MSGRLAGRVALVTGASRGIGAAVARRFGAEGAHVVLVARSQGGLAETQDRIRAAGGTATVAPLDLTRFAELDALGPTLLARFGGLDVLVAAAATLGVLTPLGHLDASVWDETVALNLTANWRLVRTLDPLLRRAAAGRAIFVTATQASEAGPYWGPYAATKAGLEALARVWAAETRATPLRVNLIDPGPVATRLRAAAYPGEDPARLRQPDAITDAFVELASPACRTSGEIWRLAEGAPDQSDSA